MGSGRWEVGGGKGKSAGVDVEESMSVGVELGVELGPRCIAKIGEEAGGVGGVGGEAGARARWNGREMGRRSRP